MHSTVIYLKAHFITSIPLTDQRVQSLLIVDFQIQHLKGIPEVFFNEK